MGDINTPVILQAPKGHAIEILLRLDNVPPPITKKQPVYSELSFPGTAAFATLA
jgi:hypothetical protein